MSNIKDLERQLAEAKQKEAKEKIEKEVQMLKEEFEGKCFATHTFRKSSRATFVSAVYYESIYAVDNEIYALEHVVMKDTSNQSLWDKPLKQFLYEYRIAARNITSTKTDSSWHRLRSPIIYATKEISLDKFNQLASASIEIEALVNEHFFKTIDTCFKTDTMGDVNDDGEYLKIVKELNIDVIDLTEYPEVYNIVKHKVLPLVERNRWILKQYAKPVLSKVIDQLQKSYDFYVIWGDLRGINRYSEEIDIIKSFINSLK